MSAQAGPTSGVELRGIAQLRSVYQRMVMAIQVRDRLVLLDHGGELQAQRMHIIYVI